MVGTVSCPLAAWAATFMTTASAAPALSCAALSSTRLRSRASFLSIISPFSGYRHSNLVHPGGESKVDLRFSLLSGKGDYRWRQQSHRHALACCIDVVRS